MAFDWNAPGREAELRKLVAEGKSASEISRHFGGGPYLDPTRCAAIGKVKRLGLSLGGSEASSPRQKSASQRASRPEGWTPKPTRPPKARTPSSFVQSPQGHTPPTPEKPVLIVAGVTPRPWITRKFGECAYPVGGEEADTLSCCAPCGEGARYCPDHSRVMYSGFGDPRLERLSKAVA